MECQRLAKLLVVLTLLQLCRAELKEVQPRWYSANLINNGLPHKSIEDLFSTEPSFSTSNPIIVSSTPSNTLSRDFNLLSTLAPPTSHSSSTSDFSSTTFSPFSQSTLPPQQQYVPQINQNQQLFNLDQPTSVEIHQQTSPADFEPIQPMVPQRNVQIQQTQSSTQTLPPSPPVIKLTTFYQPPSTDATLSTDIRYDFQDTQTSLGPQSSSATLQTNPQMSNYFLIYQGPQSIQGNPTPSPITRITAAETFTTISPVTSTFPSTFSSTTPMFSTTESPITLRTSPVYYSTTGTLLPQQLSPVRASGLSIGNCTVESTTKFPSKTIPGIRPFDGRFPLHIKISAPSGSKTNLNFNTPVKRSSTTRKPTTTTRKPTTRRTPKPKKNTYERCLQGCRKNGQTLCAAPLSQNPVDPKTLRGFQSVCHMACHNSYRQYPYEKLVDGSCGKLRTRIRPFDTNTKLKKDELTKVQYTVDNSNQQAILEFSGTYV